MRITELKILQGIPFTKEDNRWLTFNSLAEQTDFFSQYSIESFYELSFVRGFAYKKIKVKIDYDKILYANYIMFKNRDYNDKWLYAYIKDFTYLSDGCTEIEIEMDYFQSYISEIKFMPCRIERQMAIDRDDPCTIENGIVNSENFQDINLEKVNTIASLTFKYDNWSVCILYKPNLVIESLTGGGQFKEESKYSINDEYTYRNFLTDANYNSGIVIFNKYWSGTALLCYPINNQSAVNTLATKVWQLEVLGYTIVRMFMIPTILTETYYEEATNILPNHPLLTQNKMVEHLYKEPYKPKNNKTYQYIYYEVSNHNGTIKKYNIFDFIQAPLSNTDTTFKIITDAHNGLVGVTFPRKYKTHDGTTTTQWDYGVELGQAPDTTWNDQFASFVKQFAGILASVGATAIAGVPIGATTGSNILKQTAQAPFESANNNSVKTSPLLNIIANTIGWTYKLIAPWSLNEIDDYFSIYGYSMSIVCEPFVHNKQRWNYVKTQNANIQGLIPIKAKKEIEEALNKGITFWHDKSNFDYTDNNGELTNLYIDDYSGLTADFKLF